MQLHMCKEHCPSNLDFVDDIAALSDGTKGSQLILKFVSDRVTETLVISAGKINVLTVKRQPTVYHCEYDGNSINIVT